MDGNEDRTSYSDGERVAAEYLRDTLVGYGYADGETEETSMIREFMTKEQVTNNNGTTSTVERRSQNVVAVYVPDGLPENHKNVVVGAYYDNRYSSLSGAGGTKSNGALANGTGVAALLAISEYLQTEKPKLDFSVTTVFFGASAVNNAGATKYYDQMTAEEKTNTVLMIELQRLGVDHVYAYSDSRETKRETFFDGVAKKSGLDIYKVTQQSPAITGINGGLNGIPYYQWAMNGTFAVFFNHNIPTLNIVGANWETFGLTDSESADNDDIELTANDTLQNFQKLYPDYGEKIATAASLIVDSFNDPDFLSTMEYDSEKFPDTDILTKNWIWYLVALGVVLIAGGAMTLVSSRLAKKYPVVMPAPRKVKMAVFGMDYEDRKDDEIYVDIRSPQMDEIFPGVPNNDGAAGFGNPNDPFPAYPPMTDAVEQKKEEQAKDSVSEVIDLEPKKEQTPAEPKTTGEAQAEPKEETQNIPETPADTAEVVEESADKAKTKTAASGEKTTTTKKTPAKSAAPKPAPKKRPTSTKKPIKSDKVDAANKESDNE